MSIVKERPEWVRVVRNVHPEEENLGVLGLKLKQTSLRFSRTAAILKLRKASHENHCPSAVS